MTTSLDLIEATGSELNLNSRRQLYDILNGTITNSAATLVVTDDTNATTGPIQPGSVLEIDLEKMLVRSRVTTTITVLRGQFGTTAAAHTNGAIIRIDPLFGYFDRLQAINNELDALSSPENGLFAVATPLELTYNASVQGYNLTGVTDVQKLLHVAIDTPGSAKNWVRIPPSRYRLVRQGETDDFASGFAVILYEGGSSGQQLRVVYATKFTRLSTLADDVQSVAKLPATANDIPPLGAAMRLVYPTEVARNFTRSQSDPRADERVPAGAKLRSAAGVTALRDRRISEERARLMRDWPELMR